MSLLGSWWSPDTDVGVAVQVAATIAVGIILGLAVRKENSLVLLVIGMTLITLGWYGIRGLY